MILFISNIGASLPIVYRMRQEGIDTKIYINKESYKTCYDGIIPKVELGDLKKEVLRAEKVIFDSDVNLEALGDCLDGKSSCRSFEIEEAEILKETGMKTKKDVSGIKITAEMWFNGKESTLYTYCLPGQQWLTGNLGHLMSSQTNCLWITDKPGLLVDSLNALIPLLIKNSYVGPVSIDCVIGSREKKPYYDSFHVGLRYDNIFCLLELVSISKFITNNSFDSHEGFACSERITIAPYPYTAKALLDGIAKDVRIKTSLGNGFWCQDIKDSEDGLKCAGNDGLLGIMTATGSRIENSFGKIYKSIRKLEVDAPLQFRIDGLRETTKKIKKLRTRNLV